ncbi:MAG: AAA family ATPase [Campylobacterales bacterium]|nr:AAA family ATPase [Campylobacterales bacterium]
MKTLLTSLFELSNQRIQNQKAVYHRFLFDTIIDNHSKFSGIYGSRGVGKTTLMLQIAKALDFKSDEILYLSCDHPFLADVSLFELVSEFHKYGGKCILIDEVHEAVHFEQELKSIYDFLDIKVLFSGSSAIKLTNPSFTRRYAMYHLPILSFREYLELSFDRDVRFQSFSFEEIIANHVAITNDVLKQLDDEKILKHFEHYLKIGAYPFYFENKQNYIQMVLDTINTILYADLGSIYNISGEKVTILRKLLTSICVSNPLELSIESLAQKVGTSKVTLYKYIELLHKAELLRHIVYEGKRFKSMQKPDKLYLANTTLFSSLCIDSKIGTIRESFFASQVSQNASIYYVNRGDFLIDEKYTVEIGGKNKNFEQLKEIENSFVIADEIEIGFGNKIPLWLFGFLY